MMLRTGDNTYYGWEHVCVFQNSILHKLIARNISNPVLVNKLNELKRINTSYIKGVKFAETSSEEETSCVIKQTSESMKALKRAQKLYSDSLFMTKEIDTIIQEKNAFINGIHSSEFIISNQSFNDSIKTVARDCLKKRGFVLDDIS